MFDECNDFAIRLDKEILGNCNFYDIAINDNNNNNNNFCIYREEQNTLKQRIPMIQ